MRPVGTLQRYAASALAALMATPGDTQPSASVAPRAMQALTPALASYTDQILFGDVWKRPALSPRDRSLVTVAVLIATGRTAQLTGHLGRALDNGVKPAEIAALTTHLAFYSGWPSAVSALDVIERVFQERGVDVATLRMPAPLLPLPDSDAVRAQMVEDRVAPTAPKLAALTNDILFGDLWRRPDLAPRDRSLVTIAALAAAGDGDQLAFHIRHGLANGLTRDQIAEALTHLAFYAGWPKAMAAVAIARDTFAAPAAAPEAGQSLQIIRRGAAPKPGPASNFTGVVTVDTAFQGSGGARLGGASVTFAAGAHSNWHSHPLGQLLIVTAGHGWVQAEGEPVRAIGPGDVVWTAPGVKHWHGATRIRAMTHVAVAETQNGASVRWREPVTDAEYDGPM